MTTVVTEVAGAAPATDEMVSVGYLKEGGYYKTKEEFSNAADAQEILLYIDFLCQNNATSVDDMKLPFKPGEKNKVWKLSRAEVNDLFFSHLEKKKADEKSNVRLPDEDERKLILNHLKNQKLRYKRNIQDEVDGHIIDLRETMDAVNGYIEKIRDKRSILESDDGILEEERLRKLIEELPSTNWDFNQITSSHISFVNRSEVILRHSNPSAGLNYELNCGKFLCEIHLASMNVRMRRHKRNAPTRNPHPHVHRDGDVCFGNGADAYNDARINGDILTILKLLDRMLPNYGGNPYVSLEDLMKDLEKRDALEREEYGKKEKAKSGKSGSSDSEEEEILDDEPGFEDDNYFEE